MQFYKFEGLTVNDEWSKENDNRRLLREKIRKISMKTNSFNQNQQRKAYAFVTDASGDTVTIGIIDKDYNDFYKTAPRNSNGAVDWKKLSEKELDIFDYLYKQHEKLLKKLSDLEDKIDVDNALNIFLQVNTHSQSF